MLRQSGYKDGGHVNPHHPDEAEDKKLIKKMVGKAKIKVRKSGGGVAHPEDAEECQHEGMRLRAGGKVDGGDVAERPDRKRRAAGGGMESTEHHAGGHKGGKGHPKITVNVIDGKGDDQQAEQMGEQKGLQAGTQIGARQVMAKMAPPPGAGPAGPPRPPMPMPPGVGAPPGPGGPPGAGAMPPPGMPPHPPMPGQMAKDGGTIKVRAHERRRGGTV